MRILITIALLFTAGCTCNDAKNPAARPRAAKNMKGKIRGKMKGKMKGKRKAISKITVGVYYVDQTKLEAGEEDFWVKVDREVGSKTPAKNAVWQLFKGPTDDEMAEGITLFKSGSAGFKEFKVDGSVATLQLREGCSSEGATVTVYDHITKTLKEFPEIDTVKLLDPDGATQDLEGPDDSRPACLEP